MHNSLLWQLADSAFPAGGFAHSFGFEALRAHGLLRGERELQLRLDELAWHTAHGVLPFATDAYMGDAVATDLACDRFLTNHVGNRASRAQGAAFLIAIRELELGAPLALPCRHLPVAMAAALAPRLALAELRELIMFTTLRSAMSAAIRLGVVGPLRAQRILLASSATAGRALAATGELRAAQACAISPVLELAQASHDRLYARLFQS
jgi:urease accessory protein